MFAPVTDKGWISVHIYLDIDMFAPVSDKGWISIYIPGY